MRELEYLVLGYIHIKVSDEDFYKAVSLFLGKGIRIFSKNKCEILIFHSQRKAAVEVLAKAGIDYSIIKEYNLFEFEKNRVNAAILISAAIFSLIFAFFLSSLVWRIEVDGCENTSEAEVISALEDSGLAIGTMWRKIDYGDIENSVLNKSLDIAWININRVGTVAYVSIIEAEAPKSDTETYKYSNIVASEDCIIESISVTMGTPMVKVGDAVTKGDLLILGMQSTDKSSTPCKAAGSVIGRVNSSVSVTVSRKQTGKVEESRALSSLNIKIFNFSVNIFKKYRNFNKECAIIEENGQISLFDGKALPIFIEKQYSVKYKRVSYDLCDDDLVSLAGELMRQRIEGILADVRLKSIKTNGSFTDEGYVMTTDMVYLCDVCEDVEFIVSEN